MSFSLANPTGWTNGDLLTETQINQLDQDHAAAVDGGGGGTYTLTAPLQFVGDEVDIDVLNANTIIGTPEFTGNATFSSTSTFDGIATFNDDVNFSGGGTTYDHTANFNHDVNLGNTSGDTVTVAATSAFAGPATFSGTSTFDAAVIFNSTATIGSDSSDVLTVKSTSIFQNDLTIGNSSSDGLSINSTVNIAGVVGYISTGRTLETGVSAANADTAYDIATYRHIYIPSSTTGTHTYTLSCTGEQDGDWFIIQNDDSGSHTVAGIVSIPTLEALSGRKYLRIAGTWRAVQVWDYLT